MRREVTRVITPGTVTEDDLLDPRGPNHLVALCRQPALGLAWLDLSTGAFQAAEFLMDYLKANAPFWKREETAAGTAWVDARSHDDAAAARWTKS